MGSFSIWHWLIVLAVMLLSCSAAAARFRDLMKDLGQGITAFRKGLKEPKDGEQAAGREQRQAAGRHRPLLGGRRTPVGRRSLMFDLGWGELLVVGAVALVVLGPKELPNALRTISNLTKTARKLAGEFQSGVNEIVREAELEDARKAAQSISKGSISKAIGKVVDPTGEMKSSSHGVEKDVKQTRRSRFHRSARSRPCAVDGPDSARCDRCA